MNGDIKAAFDKVHADDSLKERTKAFISQKTRGYTSRPAVPTRRGLLSAVACLAIAIITGYFLYFTPTLEISVDLNPSLELSVNRFDRVIGVTCNNESAEALVASLGTNLKHMDCAGAVELLLTSDEVSGILTDGGLMTIGVIGEENAQSERILSEMEHCSAGVENAHCYFAHYEDLEHAHELGLSFGKYRALLELQALDPSFTADDITGMTMREIRDLIDALGGSATTTPEGTNSSNHGHAYGQGQGQEHGQGHGNRYGAG